MPRDEPFSQEKAYCAIQALNSVILALVETHPNKAALAEALRVSAERSRDFLLETKNSDSVIDQIEKGILHFARYAEEYSQPNCRSSQTPETV